MDAFGYSGSLDITDTLVHPSRSTIRGLHYFKYLPCAHYVDIVGNSNFDSVLLALLASILYYVGRKLSELSYFSRNS